jgi:sphingolipid delta-4 desaturase
MNPKSYTAKEALNLVTVISFDVALCYFVGYKALLFNFISTLLGMGLHPVAGHFIAEHYTLAGMETNQETFSYYGPLNYVTFFVGYHNEHHDFPRVSGFKLAQVKALAPEYYDNLHSYDSWCGVIYDYITRPDIGLVRPRKVSEGTSRRLSQATFRAAWMLFEIRFDVLSLVYPSKRRLFAMSHTS